MNAAIDGIVATCKAAGIRVKVDANLMRTPGFKFNYWEMKGVPVRIEIGPRDVAADCCVVARRDVPGKEGKMMGQTLEPAAFTATVQGILAEIQVSLPPSLANPPLASPSVP